MAYLHYFNDLICDSTCFSVSSFDESIPYISNSMTSAQPDAAPAAASARTPPAHIFPTLPLAHNFSVLGNASQFRKYIFPWLLRMSMRRRHLHHHQLKSLVEP